MAEWLMTVLGLLLGLHVEGCGRHGLILVHVVVLRRLVRELHRLIPELRRVLRVVLHRLIRVLSRLTRELHCLIRRVLRRVVRRAVGLRLLLPHARVTAVEGLLLIEHLLNPNCLSYFSDFLVSLLLNTKRFHQVMKTGEKAQDLIEARGRLSERDTCQPTVHLGSLGRGLARAGN